MQRPAYDMRIIDWCSDVCSSDLCGHLGNEAREVGGVRAGEDGAVELGRLQQVLAAVSDQRAADEHDLRQAVPQDKLEDRKSVGEGKSVSVRVDIGGSRITKKKNQCKKVRHEVYRKSHYDV